MKNFKKLTIFLLASLFGVNLLPCEAAFKSLAADFSSDTSSCLTLENYKPNSCIRDYTSADRDQARQILKENDLGFSLGMESCVTLVYEEKDIVKGVCIANSSDGYVYRVAVGKKYQCQGIGKHLLHEVIHVLHTEYEINEISLHSEQSSVGFYKKMGFRLNESSLKCFLTFV